eukprot:312247-Prymnesium_polylepis.1
MADKLPSKRSSRLAKKATDRLDDGDGGAAAAALPSSTIGAASQSASDADVNTAKASPRAKAAPPRPRKASSSGPATPSITRVRDSFRQPDAELSSVPALPEPDKACKRLVKLEVLDKILSSPGAPPRNNNAAAGALLAAQAPWGGDKKSLGQWVADLADESFSVWDASHRAALRDKELARPAVKRAVQKSPKLESPSQLNLA